MRYPDVRIHSLELLDARDKKHRSRLASLRRSPSVTVIDTLTEQLAELNEIRRPPLSTAANRARPVLLAPGDNVWVYYPWRDTLVRTLREKLFIEVRVSRNNGLITPAEMKKFARVRIGVAGLNVGNPAAVCIALEGGGRKMKFADPDTLSLSNLNRFRAGLPDLGLNKAILSARQVLEINPYAKIDVWEKGISRETLDKFLLKPRLDILIEEMDNLPLKVAIREVARKNRIPVLMVTGNGENVIIDVERFDINPRLPLLNGHLKESIIRRIHGIKPPTLEEKIALARDFMGARFLAPRLRESFKFVGRRLAGIPQLGEASFLRGAAVCFFARNILTGKKVVSGRYFLNQSDFI